MAKTPKMPKMPKAAPPHKAMPAPNTRMGSKPAAKPPVRMPKAGRGK